MKRDKNWYKASEMTRIVQNNQNFIGKNDRNP